MVMLILLLLIVLSFRVFETTKQAKVMLKLSMSSAMFETEILTPSCFKNRHCRCCCSSFSVSRGHCVLFEVKQDKINVWLCFEYWNESFTCIYKKSNILTALIWNRHMKNTLGFKMMRALDSKLQQTGHLTIIRK